MSPRLDTITPLVSVSDIDDAVQFFEEAIGFAVTVRMPGYAYIKRDTVAIRLIDAPPGVDMHDEARQTACYIDVTNLDALYALMKQKLDQLLPGKVRAPFNQEYGQREFHVIYEALLIFFGEPIAEKQ